MKRSEIAAQTGCNIETVRYYEKAGLLADPPRTAKGYRVYDDSHERTLRFIIRSRELGFSIEEIRNLLDLVQGEKYSCGEVRDQTMAHLIAVRARISDLQQLEKTLAKTVSQCEGGNTPNCPIVDALVGID